jgi:hypothetical protein
MRNEQLPHVLLDTEEMTLGLPQNYSSLFANYKMTEAILVPLEDGESYDVTIRISPKKESAFNVNVEVDPDYDTETLASYINNFGTLYPDEAYEELTRRMDCE